MRTLLVATLLLAGPASGQVSSARTVLRAGDVLADGTTVVLVRGVSISDTASWGVNVTTPNGDAFVVDGSVALAAGDIVGGDPIIGIHSAELTTDGRVVAIVRTRPAGGGTISDRLLLDGQVVLQRGDQQFVPSVGGFRTIESILSVDVAGGELAIACDLSVIGQGSPALLFGRLSGGGIVLWEEVLVGDMMPGLSGPFRGETGDIHVTTNRNWAGAVLVGVPGGTVPAFLADGVGSGEPGTPAPTPGATWTITFNSRIDVALGEGGLLARSGVIQLANGATRGIIYRGADEVIRQGDWISAPGGGVVAPFENAPIEITEADDVVYKVVLTSGVELLRLADETVLAAGSSVTVSGEVVTALFAGSYGSFAASSDGRSLITLARVDGQFPTAAIVVERAIANDNLCQSTPNSTGLRGRLEVSGSRWLQFNDLSFRASELPAQQFGMLVNGTSLQLTPNPGGSAGDLCVGGSLGRHIGQIQSSGATGFIEVPVDLAAFPRPTGPIAVMSGQSFVFQLWHRDRIGGVNTSNFTDALSMRFL